MTGRSATVGNAAVESIKTSVSDHHIPGGKLEFVELDISNLETVKAFGQKFESKLLKLDVLFNNASVVLPPPSEKSPQGLDLSLATNVLGPFLLTKLLMPRLLAAENPCIIWTGSVVIDLQVPAGGLNIARDLEVPFKDPHSAYATTKLMSWYLAAEVSRLPGFDWLISIAVNLGNLRTGAGRHQPWLMQKIMNLVSHDGRHGTYTELWAGLSSEITTADSGRYATPFGRWHPSPRNDLVPAIRWKETGGTGNAKAVWDWCDERVKPYA